VEVGTGYQNAIELPETTSDYSGILKEHVAESSEGATEVKIYGEYYPVAAKFLK
jgi:hypothetical protein